MGIVLRLVAVVCGWVMVVLPVVPARAYTGACPPPGTGADGLGTPGVGDPYFPDAGNGGYRISHDDLVLHYDPASDRLNGTATLQATATQQLRRFDVDFALPVTAVAVNGVAAAFFTCPVHEVQVSPADTVDAGQAMTVTVQYSGIPSTVTLPGYESGWHRTDDGAVALGEPFSAPWWFPSNDHPSDKATMDLAVTVPAGTAAIGGGTLVSDTTRAGYTTWKWQQNEPVATYLETLAIGQFDVDTGTAADGLPMVYAYSRGLTAEQDASARASLSRTAEVVDWESGLFGPYPFDAIGGVAAPVGGTALETQTRPTYGQALFDTGSNMYVVVHENAHQWFGDAVSVRGWSDIWLNEGFARYAEWLWSEHVGDGTAAALARYTYDQYPPDDPFWQVEPGDPGAGQLLSLPAYDRGAMALESLRQAVGDDTFFRILRGWAALHDNANGTVQQFITVAQAATDVDVTSLLHTWLFTTGRPATPPAPTTTPVAPRSWAALHDNVTDQVTA